MTPTQTQDLSLTEHHDQYDAIAPTSTLSGTASGKIVLIMGASRGIGRETAICFAKAGAKAIYLTARSEQSLVETQDLVFQANSDTRCAYSICDVTNAAQVDAAVSACVEQFGGIDLVDANAGHLERWAKIGESDPESWWHTWEVNIQGTYHIIRYSIPHLIQSAKKWADIGGSGGHLVLLSSVGAQRVAPTASSYQTSKHAINRLCEFVDVDHGEDGVKCFALHPGGVATELARNMPEDRHSFLIDSPELSAAFLVWLASGRADWARGRYLSANWDVDELTSLKEEILRDDLLVNRLQTGMQ
ncbi:MULTISPECIES: SDR family oxidoreductase [unclassified Halomonas]|jgi:NAD(P)-dependent dehydrogenase (short-subunit alcohol dehydrogenase family)|uniref:SDR family oxidoreductase n=1 Tax=unclassified Halomonas TaxID=2609666 RepID=UPI0018EF97BA|nr:MULTISPECIES: SDR family oxidoreductase [unclassified Halomonas]MCO7246343.1 SDR family oxidoreductase [Halomonas sp. Mc5H-6]QPL45155.1 SDR family oxidoreductase [Halomonas sp. A40-4]